MNRLAIRLICKILIFVNKFQRLWNKFSKLFSTQDTYTFVCILSMFWNYFHFHRNHQRWILRSDLWPHWNKIAGNVLCKVLSLLEGDNRSHLERSSNLYETKTKANLVKTNKQTNKQTNRNNIIKWMNKKQKLNQSLRSADIKKTTLDNLVYQLDR